MIRRHFLMGDLKTELAKQPVGKNGLVQIPLLKSYRLLAELGDELGGRYLEQAEELGQIMQIRNMSLLAHGFEAIKEDTYQKLKKIALHFAGVEDAELPEFPHMDWREVFV